MAEINHQLQHADPRKVFRYCPRCAGRLENKKVAGERSDHPVCATCGYILFLNPKVVACTLPSLKENPEQIYLIRRGIEPACGRWTIPGGYVDLGESVEEAARRETREEMGVEVEIIGLLNLYSYHGVGSIVAVYLAQIVGREIRNCAEALEARPFDARSLPWEEIAFQSTRDALREWVSRKSLGLLTNLCPPQALAQPD